MAGKDASGASLRHPTKRTLESCLPLVRLLPLAWLLSAMLPVTLVFGQAAGPASATRAPAPAAAGTQTAPAAPAATAATTVPMPIMAVVNGEQITREILGSECLRRYGQEVLDGLINQQIIEQACQARKIVVTDRDVDEEIRNVAEKFGLSVDRWLAVLDSERDIDPAQYRRDIIRPTLSLRRLASKQISVSDEEFRQAFDSEYGPQVKARVIAASSREKADWLRQAAMADPDGFPRLAKEHSEDRATASAYGVIPPIRKHVGDPNVEQVAFSLKEGEISPVIQVGNQYLLLKCEKQIDRTFVSSEQLPVIEKDLRLRIHDHKMRAESANVFQQLQSQAQIIKVMGDAAAQRTYPGIAALINGRQISLQELSEECLVRHGREVLDGEINRKLLLQELSRRGTSVDEQDIDAEVTRAAEAYGYAKQDGKPDVEGWLKAVTEGDQTTVELYVRDAVWPSVALKKLVGSDVQVTQEDMQKGFESNFGERVEVLAIVVGSHRQAQSVWEMARNNPTDQFFGELAHQYSIEPTSRANFGQVPPLRRHGGQPLVEKEAFRLKAGELSGIVAVGDQYIILRCLGRTKPVVTELAVVQDELHKDLHEKKLRLAMAKEFDRLKEGAQIDNFLAGTTQGGVRAGSSAASQASFQQPVKSAAPGAVRR